MAQLVIDEVKARSLYKTADKSLKTMLEAEFGTDFFNTNIRQTVRSFQDACKVLGLDSKTVLPFLTDNDDTAHINAYVKLTIIAKVLNEGWTPDWSNDNEYKWYPWFDLSSGSSSVVCHGAYNWISSSYVGSRLCFKSRELAEHAGEQFLDIYKVFLLTK